MILKEELNNMAELAKLSFNDEEMEILTTDISNYVNLIERIKEVNTDNVEITEQLDLPDYSLREDIVKDSLSREEVVKNTFEEQYGYFKILNVMD